MIPRLPADLGFVLYVDWEEVWLCQYLYSAVVGVWRLTLGKVALLGFLGFFVSVASPLVQVEATT